MSIYSLEDDLLSIIPKKELINLSNDTPSNEINTDTVDTCACFADELINAYLRNKYSLPLDYIPGLVKQLAADITGIQIIFKTPERCT